MAFQLLTCVVLAVVVSVHSLPPRQVTVDHCEYQNQMYKIGEKTNNVCQPCTCTSGGRMACMVIDCFFRPMCVDPVRLPGRCCQTCPNEGASIANKGADCVIGNRTYHAGETIDSNPCRPCFCSGGGLFSCAIVDCAMAICVDPVRQAGQCCPICPNGHNCKHGSHIIKAGEVYKPDAHTTCQCSTQLFGAHALQATCTKTV